MPFPHWGDVPTWVTAGVALAALIAAIRAYRKQAHAYDKQSEQVDLQRQQFQDQQQANRKQAEVSELQARELRESLARLEHEAAERRQAQARRIVFWDERTVVKRARIRVIDVDDAAPATPTHASAREVTVTAHVRNDSELPIWNLTLTWHLGRIRVGQPDHIRQLRPGEHQTLSRPLDPGDGDLPHEADLTFRDASQITWRLTLNGDLEDLS